MDGMGHQNGPAARGNADGCEPLPDRAPAPGQRAVAERGVGAAERRLIATATLHAITATYGETGLRARPQEHARHGDRLPEGHRPSHQGWCHRHGRHLWGVGHRRRLVRHRSHLISHLPSNRGSKNEWS